MNNQTLMQKVEKLIKDKKYDKRFVPMIITFFLVSNKVYNLSEAELDEMIHNYSENVDRIEYFNIGTNNSIAELDRKSIILDASYIEKVDESNIDNYLRQSIRVQSIVTNKQRITNEEEKQLIQLNGENNLYDKHNPIIERLFNMLFASFGTNEIDITKVMKQFEHEYQKIANDRSNPKRNYYDEMIFYIYKYITTNFGEISKNGITNVEVLKRIYALCMYNLETKIEALGKEEQDVGIYQTIKRNMHEIQTEYGISDEELTNIDIESNWQLPVKSIEDRIMSILGRDELSTEQDNISTAKQVPVIKRDKLIDMINNQIENKAITQEDIENSVKQMALENNYPVEIISIINEYIKRSVQIYGWSKDTLQKKIENFGNNIKQFTIERMEDKSAATVKLNDKKMIFEDVIFVSNNFVNTIFHEMRHATDFTSRDYKTYECGSNIQHNETNTKSILDEMLVEGGTQLLTGTRYTDKLCSTLKLTGYEGISYILSMVSSAIGMSEVEFLKLGEKGIVRLKDAIDEKYKDNTISNKLYELDDLLKDSLLTGQIFKLVLRKEMASKLGQIYNICQDMYNLRMKKFPPKTEQEQLKAKYEKYKINKNLLQGGKDLGIHTSTLEEKIGISIGQVKNNAELTKEEKKKIINQIISKQENIKWDNKQVIQYIKLFRKALKRGRPSENLLPPAKSGFLEDIKVEMTYSRQEIGNSLREEDLIQMPNKTNQNLISQPENTGEDQEQG